VTVRPPPLSSLWLMLLCAAAALTRAADAPGSPPAAAAPDANAAQFNIHEYRVLGNSVLSNRQIEGVLYPRLGDEKTLADVEAARTALEEAYHSLGFATVFVDIPPQDVADGVVRLHVTEGRVRERSISGARYFSERKILTELPATQPGTVPQLQEVQKELNAVNTQTSDLSVVPILKAGPEPGTTDLALKVDDHLPLHGSLEVNNQYTPDTKPLRMTASLGYNNLFADLDSISMQYTTAPQKPDEVGVFNANYGFHPLAGVRPSLSFTNSSSNVLTIGTLGVLGDGQVVSGRANIPLLQLPGDQQSVTLGLDYKHFRNSISLASVTPGAASLEIEPISYVNASVGYTGAWHSTAGGLWTPSGSADFTADFGPRGFANTAADFAQNRFQARANYAYLRSTLSFDSNLPAHLQLLLHTTWQVALEPLVVYEQLSITGANAVRGYLEAESLGDTGITGTIQLQTQPFSRGSYKLGDGFLFFDAGRDHTIDALPGEAGDTVLRSFGVGLDLLPGHTFTGSLIWADPLVDGPRTKAYQSRLLFDVKGSF
jgi:hemolysin activation/secretion protein